MSEWKECKLGEIVTFQRGHDLTQLNFVKGEFPVAGSNGIINFHNEYTTIGPGLTLGRSGNSIGVAHYYKTNFWAHNTTLYSKEFKESYPKFIYYLLKTIDFKVFNSGSAVPSLNRNHINLLDILLPTLPEQCCIADILSSLDDKIDLLHRQNATLEAMAETLFRQWFVEEAKEDWAEGTMNDCLDLIIDYRGKTPKKLGTDWSLTGIPAISAKNIKAGKLVRPETFNYVESDLYKKWMKEELKKGDIIMTSEAPLGELYLLNSDMKFVLSQRLFALRTKKDMSPYFLYGFLSSIEGQYLIKSRASGSTVEGIRQSELREVEITIPPVKLIREFHEIVSSYFDKIQNNNNQTLTLTALRDTLLPKLMSGEVRVKIN